MAWLGPLTLACLHISAGTLRLIDANSDPAPYLLLRNASWSPPRLESGFLRSGPNGALFLHDILKDRPAKAFKLSFKARSASPTFSVFVRYLSAKAFRRRALANPRPAGGLHIDDPDLAFEFASVTELTAAVRQDGRLEALSQGPAPAPGEWFPIEIEHTELGRVNVAAAGVNLVQNLQLAFPLIVGRFLIETAGSTDLRDIRIDQLEADRNLASRVSATATNLQLRFEGPLADSRLVLAKIDDSLVPSGALGFFDGGVTIAFDRIFEPLSHHRVEVCSQAPAGISRQVDGFVVPAHDTSNETRAISIAPAGLVTAPTKLVVRMRSTALDRLDPDKVTVELDGLPLLGLSIIAGPDSISIEAPLLVCPGVHNMRVRWTEPDGSRQERVSWFEQTGPLEELREAHEQYGRAFPPGLYRVRLSTALSGSAALSMKLPDGSAALLGAFAATGGSLALLQNQNGDSADLWLDGEHSFLLEPHQPNAILLFERLIADCSANLALSRDGTERLQVRRARGTLQFSFDLVEWQNAGPLFVPGMEPVFSRLFFREVP